MYVCPWPLKKPTFEAKDYPKSEFGFYTMCRDGVDIFSYAPKRSGIVKTIWKMCPSVFAPLFTQIGCLKHQDKCDIIYIGFDMHLMPLAIMKMVGLCHKPVFVLSHFTYNYHYTKIWWKKIYKIIERWFVTRYIDRLSFANDVLLKVAVQGGALNKKHWNVANWGAVTEFYDRNIYKEKPTGEFFMAAGGMNRDYATLIEAFRHCPNAKLKIFAKYKDYTKGINIPSNVEFENLMANNDFIGAYKQLRDKYYNCKAILLPINYINDVPNGATVLVEALAMGKPIIITQADTNYIDVEREGCGMTIKPHDVEDWIRVITYLINNPNEVERMGKRSYQLAKEKYNDRNFVNTILQQMVELVNQKNNYC